MIAVFTGISRGIGRSLVEQACANSSFTKVYGISRNQEALSELESLFDVFEPIHFDIGRDDFSLLAKKFSACSRIDLLINNAGYLVNKAFEDWTHKELLDVFTVNLMAPFRLMQLLSPALRSAPSAHVVNISSMGGVQGASKFAGLSGYSSAKGALNILTECLAEEWKESKVKINALSLGAVQTEMLAEAFPGYQAPVMPDDMARYILEFALSANKVMNGKVIPLSLSTP